MAIFHRPLRRAFAGPMGWLTAKSGWFRRMRPRTRVFSLLAAVLAILFLIRTELRVSAEFTILAKHNADVRAAVEGIIEEVFVDEGDEVSEGDLIALLVDRDYRAQLQMIEAQIAEEQANLSMLGAGPRPERIGLAREEVETARARRDHSIERHEEAQQMRSVRIARAQTTIEGGEQQLEFARLDLEQYQELRDQGAGSLKDVQEAEATMMLRRQELEEAKADLRLLTADVLTSLREAMVVAQEVLEESQSRLDLLLAGSRPEVIQSSEAKIARLEAQRHHMEEQVALLRVTSPISGVITTSHLHEKVGELVERGDLIACVNELRTVRAEIAVPEKEIADVLVGQMVALKARAHPRERFEGRVISIAPTATPDEEWGLGRTITVTVELDNSRGLLRPEMTGNAKIQCGERRLLDIVTRRFVRYIRVEFWSWW
jgi:HlyD family secretion protein